jgi:hypothetical protein
MGADLFHADGQTDARTDGRADGRTDMTKLTVAIRNFAKAPKNVQNYKIKPEGYKHN